MESALLGAALLVTLVALLVVLLRRPYGSRDPAGRTPTQENLDTPHGEVEGIRAQARSEAQDILQRYHSRVRD